MSIHKEITFAEGDAAGMEGEWTMNHTQSNPIAAE